MSKTGISYLQETWNLVTGCTAISAACENCWASRQAATRLKHNPAYAGLARRTDGGRYQWTGEVRLHPEKLSEPLHWRKPRRIGVAFEGDLFHEAVLDEFIDQVFKIMALVPQHTFLVLTKRPDRQQAYIDKVTDDWRAWPLPVEKGNARIELTSLVKGLQRAWPLKNCWLGVTVENRESLWRINVLRETPAALRWISFEPLLENLGQVNLEGIGWIVLGSESGPNARPFKLDWARSVRNQSLAAGVKFYFKQCPSVVGKLIHLPELDGRQWLEMPDAK